MQPLRAPTRRTFILGSATAAGLAAFALTGPRLRACPRHADHASTGRIAPADEPGEPLEIHGTVYAADGVTPAAGVTLYAFHTDIHGLYRQPGTSGPPRLRAWFKTDASGRYSYRTIHPAAYPERKWAAHVHTQLWSDAVPAQWGSTLLFAADPLLNSAERRESAELGRFANIRPLIHKDGVWRGTHDIRLKTTGDHFEDNTRHGLNG